MFYFQTSRDHILHTCTHTHTLASSILDQYQQIIDLLKRSTTDWLIRAPTLESAQRGLTRRLMTMNTALILPKLQFLNLYNEVNGKWLLHRIEVETVIMHVRHVAQYLAHGKHSRNVSYFYIRIYVKEKRSLLSGSIWLSTKGL